MICGIGTDLSLVTRWEDKVFLEKLLRRAFTPDEAAYLKTRGKMLPESAAGLFCAKEAFLKALGSGIAAGPDLKDIEISHTSLGQPFYKIGDAAARAMETIGANRAFLSITHDGGMAAAFCVLSFEEDKHAAISDL